MGSHPPPCTKEQWQKSLRGDYHDVSNKWLNFDPTLYHAVEPVTSGHRVSIALFSPKRWKKLPFSSAFWSSLPKFGGEIFTPQIWGVWVFRVHATSFPIRSPKTATERKNCLGPTGPPPPQETCLPPDHRRTTSRRQAAAINRILPRFCSAAPLASVRLEL